MSPSNKKRVKKISNTNFKRMRMNLKNNSKCKLTELTHKQIYDATEEFLKAGGKITKCEIQDEVPNHGLQEVDTFLLGV